MVDISDQTGYEFTKSIHNMSGRRDLTAFVTPITAEV